MIVDRDGVQSGVDFTQENLKPQTEISKALKNTDCVWWKQWRAYTCNCLTKNYFTHIQNNYTNICPNLYKLPFILFTVLIKRENFIVNKNLKFHLLDTLVW